MAPLRLFSESLQISRSIAKTGLSHSKFASQLEKSSAYAVQICKINDKFIFKRLCRLLDCFEFALQILAMTKNLQIQTAYADDFTNLFNFATNIQDRVGVVKLEFGRFQAKLPLSGSERRNRPNSSFNPFGMGNFQ